MNTPAKRTGRKPVKRTPAKPEPVAVAAPARIRIPNEVVDYILTNKPEMPTLDRLQCMLSRLADSGPTADDRILVTQDQDVVDLLRDWCARLIAESVLKRREGADGSNAMTGAASKVVGFIDQWEIRNSRHANAG